MSLRTNVLTNESATTTVTLHGDIDVTCAAELRTRLSSLLDDGHNELLINMAEVSFIDSTGLGVLVDALVRAREEGGDIELIELTGVTRKIFELTSLDSLFSLDDAS